MVRAWVRTASVSESGKRLSSGTKFCTHPRAKVNRAKVWHLENTELRENVSLAEFCHILSSTLREDNTPRTNRYSRRGLRTSSMTELTIDSSRVETSASFDYFLDLRRWPLSKTYFTEKS